MIGIGVNSSAGSSGDIFVFLRKTPMFPNGEWNDELNWTDKYVFNDSTSIILIDIITNNRI